LTEESEPSQAIDVCPALDAESDDCALCLNDILTTDPDSFVDKYTDIAAINLACALGLPNSDDIGFAKYLTLLNTMADAARRQTEKSWRLFKLKPAEFNHSENVFRVMTMEHVLRMQFGVKYDPLRSHLKPGIAERKLSLDSADIFIHGILSERRTGTCSSLPTFSIAVGRRLDYPLKLVRVPNHTLFRWDDGRETFNIQHTASGSELRSDEHYHEWPEKWDADMFALNTRCKVWLHSMTPRQEVSKFLCNRAMVLRDGRRFQDAITSIDAAERFDPVNPACTDIRFDVQQRMTGGVLIPPMPALYTSKLPSTAPIAQWKER
jgi:hypothetical protein